MTALSTHDTKRAEDVRARISVISEVPSDWAAAVRRWNRLAPLGDGPLPTCSGRPPSAPGRSSGTGCTPTRRRPPGRPGCPPPGSTPTPPSRSGCTPWSTPSTTTPSCTPRCWRLAARLARPAGRTRLSAKLIQLTAPGRAGRLPGHRAVGPVAGRPGQPAAGGLPAAGRTAGPHRRRLAAAGRREGAAKLLVTSRALRLRRDRPGPVPRLHPVAAPASAAEHVFAFDRGGALTVATRLPVGLAAAGGWRDTPC